MKRGRQIALLTHSRSMPPWLPKAGYGEFANQRSLSHEQIAKIQEWVEQGAVEGDTAEAPPPPRFASGWQLGQPDLVVIMSQPYMLTAQRGDVFRNFVVPIPISSPQYVQAVELHPGNPARPKPRRLFD